MESAPHILRHPSESLFIRIGKYASTLWYRCLCKYNDMVIAVRCGKFPCHKLVVGCHSRFFEEIFVNKKHTEVILVDLDLPQFLYITKPALERVLQWMYNGEYQAPTEDNESRIVSNIVADFQIDGLVPYVGRRRSLRDKAGMGESDESGSKILNLRDLVGTQAYLDLDADSVIALLSDDHLCILTEMDVFNAAWTWVYRDRGHRLRYIKRLMACVRFPLMTTRELLQCGAILINYEECHDFIIVSGWYHTSMRYRDQNKMFFIVPKRRSGIGQGVSVPAPSFSLTGLYEALPLAVPPPATTKILKRDPDVGLKYEAASRDNSLEDGGDDSGVADAVSVNNYKYGIPSQGGPGPLNARDLRLDDMLLLDDGEAGELRCRVCGNDLTRSMGSPNPYRTVCQSCGNEAYVLGREEAPLFLFIKSHVMAEVERFRASRRGVPLDECIRLSASLLEAIFDMMARRREVVRRPLGLEDIRYSMPSWTDIYQSGGAAFSRGSGQGSDDLIQIIEKVVPRLQECVDMLRRGLRGRTGGGGPNRYGTNHNPDKGRYGDSRGVDNRADYGRYRGGENRSPDAGPSRSRYNNQPVPMPINNPYNQQEPPYPPQPPHSRFYPQAPINNNQSRRFPVPPIGPPPTGPPLNMSPQTSSDLEKGGSDERKKIKKKKKSKPVPGIPEGEPYEYEVSGGGGEKGGVGQGKSSKGAKMQKNDKEKSRAQKKSSDGRSQKRAAGKSKRSKGEKSLATKSVRSKKGKTKLMIEGQSIHPPPQRGAIPMPGIGGRATAPANIKARSKIPD